MLRKLDSSSASPSPRWIVSAAVLGGLTVASQITALPIYEDIAKPANTNDVAPSQPAGPTEATSDTRASESYIQGWHGSEAARSWYFDLSHQMRRLAKMPEGWKGEGSQAATRQTLHYAQDLLWKLAQEKVDRQPEIGLDHEGTFSFMWFDDDVRADLTVYGDGTYSFFAQGDGSAVSVDTADIGDPLDSRLLSVLLS